MNGDQMQQEQIPISEMVDNVRAGKMDRRTLIKKLALIGLTTAGAGAIAAVAAREIAPSMSQPHAGGDRNAQQHVQQHKQHLSYQTSGNIQQMHQDYHEQAIVEDSMYPHPFIGREEIMKRKQAGLMAMPDLEICVTNRIVNGDQLMVEWIASGTHLTDYPGLPATGRAFAIPGVTVVVRREGKIVRESLYYDMGEVRRQLGV
jgi:steroid delta-isomerase-like uncharacterized protein